jgi:hypothetical protein
MNGHLPSLAGLALAGTMIACDSTPAATAPAAQFDGVLPGTQAALTIDDAAAGTNPVAAGSGSVNLDTSALHVRGLRIQRVALRPATSWAAVQSAERCQHR